MEYDFYQEIIPVGFVRLRDCRDDCDCVILVARSRTGCLWHSEDTFHYDLMSHLAVLEYKVFKEKRFPGLPPLCCDGQ